MTRMQDGRESRGVAEKTEAREPRQHHLMTGFGEVKVSVKSRTEGEPCSLVIEPSTAENRGVTTKERPCMMKASIPASVRE